MLLSPITALSPLDGRYGHKTAQLRPIVSEYGLMFYRLTVEIHWLIALSENRKITEIPRINTKDRQLLLALLDAFDESEAAHIKNIEKTTNHDVKSVEYYLRDKLETQDGLKHLCPFIHFACTSEDINNLAYALMVKRSRDEILAPQLQTIIDKIDSMAIETATLSMLSRTHGQPATPTTLGKELKNFATRLTHQYKTFVSVPVAGKCNGAVGNYNAHIAAYPKVDWLTLSQKFVENLGLQWNAYTTQIEPHDQLAQLFNALSVCHNVLIDFCQDIWGYISLGYFSQRKAEHEVGSSTMPHKINPIDFENAEGNLGLAIALSTHLANKLPRSRWQRDLTDSTVLRNMGCVFGYATVSYQSLSKGLDKLVPAKHMLENALNQHWEVLAEPIQTVMRRYGVTNAYEQLKTLTRGETMTQEKLAIFIDTLTIPDEAKAELKALTPANYTGLAVVLAQKSL